jgi:hypothetical protein
MRRIKPTLPEIFDEISQTNSINERVRILKDNKSPELMSVLKYSFDQTLERGFDTIPEYKADDAPLGYSYNKLVKSYRKFPFFFGKSKHSNHQKRTLALVRILENTHYREAEIFAETVTQTLKRKNLTEFLVRKSFPSLLPDTA